MACNLKEVYPEGATEFSSEEDKLRKRPEFSFEEIKLKKNNKKYSVDPWADWEWLDAWTSEAERNGGMLNFIPLIRRTVSDYNVFLFSFLSR